MAQRIYRLAGYDYSKARVYMVTLRLHPDAQPLSILDSGMEKYNYVNYTPLTQPFRELLTEFIPAYFHHQIAIEAYTLMPNHLHILIRIKSIPKGKNQNLIAVVSILRKFLIKEYQRITGDVTSLPPIEEEWYDSIAFGYQAILRLKRYIKTNPERTLRRRKSTFCHARRYTAKDGTLWHYYGNFELLRLPTVLGVDCSRKIREGSYLWQRWKQVAQYISVASAGIGTFMSPCEKMVREEILAAGGSLIVLLPEGISPYWHPGEEMEKLCAAGRVLYLTPFEATRGRASAKVLYERCHAGGGLKELIQKVACNIQSPPRE